LKEIEELLIDDNIASTDGETPEGEGDVATDTFVAVDESCTDNDKPQTVLETLNGWLSNIRERRGHV